jgi:hypothetical protein
MVVRRLVMGNCCTGRMPRWPRGVPGDAWNYEAITSRAGKARLPSEMSAPTKRFSSARAICEPRA